MNVVKQLPEAEKFLNESPHQDVAEWIMTLTNAIFKKLDGNLQDQLKAMIQSQIDEIHGCSGMKKVSKLSRAKCHQHTHSNSRMILKVPIIDLLTGQPLRTLPDVLNYYVSKREITSYCYQSGETCKKCKSNIIQRSEVKRLPDVLLIQYNRFNQSDGQKLNHDIECGNAMTAFNVHYELKGVIVHTGDSIHEGHYVTLTWNSQTESWNVLPTSTTMSTSITTYIKQAYVMLFQRTNTKDKEQEQEQEVPANETTTSQNVKTNNLEYSSLMKARHDARLPPMQQALSLVNPLNVCYANAGTNVLISSPAVSSFMAALPDSEGLLEIVKTLALTSPNTYTDLGDLRRTVAAHVDIVTNFENVKIQQDACEWIIALYQTIETQLNGDLKDRFIAMFKIQLRITYQCIEKLHTHAKEEISNILPLPVVDSVTKIPINNLTEVLNKYLQKEVINRCCHNCGSNMSSKQLSITLLPQVLIIQYLRFTAEGTKLDHSITADTSLKLNNIEYELTGILVHDGESIRRGHYYTITRCWETGIGYYLHDNNHPTIMSQQQVVENIQKAYILVFCRKSAQAEALLAPTINNQGPRHTNYEATTKPMEEEVTAAESHTEVRRTGELDTSQEALIDEDERLILQMCEKKKNILDIPVKKRTEIQKKEYRSLQYNLNKIKDKVNRLMDKFPYLKEKTKPVMTDAEKKSAQ